MIRQQADAFVAALALLGDDLFTLTSAAENDIRPRLVSRQARIGLTVSLHAVASPADWSIKLLYRDLTTRQAFEISDIERVTVDADTRSIFVWCRHHEHAFCFGLTPHKSSRPFDLWNEAAKETCRWQ